MQNDLGAGLNDQRCRTGAELVVLLRWWLEANAELTQGQTVLGFDIIPRSPRIFFL